MKISSVIKRLLGLGCEFSSECKLYDASSYACNNSPLKADGGSYCGMHRSLKEGQ